MCQNGRRRSAAFRFTGWPAALVRTPWSGSEDQPFPALEHLADVIGRHSCVVVLTAMAAGG